MYRYFLSLPAKDDNLIPLSDGHFLIVHPDYLVKTEQGFTNTHMRWICLADVTAPTMWVMAFLTYGEISAENKNLLVLSSDAKKGDKLLFEINLRKPVQSSISTHLMKEK